MKSRLVAWLRCPSCRSPLALSSTEIDAGEIVTGTLACAACGVTYPVRGGVPRLLRARRGADPVEQTKAHTAEMFGYGWEQARVDGPHQPGPWHYAKMERALGLAPIRGVVLDAGCGDGVDTANQAMRGAADVIGVELSDGGVEQAARRVRGIPNAHVVQADLCFLPFADATFDWVYSYGVLHHIPTPDAAIREIARAAKAGATLAIYLYEDFVERSTALRTALAAANAWRVVTVRMPPKLLWACCRAASPVLYALCTVPSRLLRRAGATMMADAIPFRHGTNAFGMAGDLYDRLSAPVELRYTRAEAEQFVRESGFAVTGVANDRGWMIAGCRAADLL